MHVSTELIMQKWKEYNELFVETKASKEVARLIECQNIVIVTGHIGSGKSAVVHRVALNYRCKGKSWNVKPIYSVLDMKQSIDSLQDDTIDNKILFVLNDPIGKESFDEINYTSWRKYEDFLKACLKKFKLLLSCRKYILSDDKVQSCKRNIERKIKHRRRKH